MSNPIDFIKQNLNFFLAAAEQPDQFIRWVTIVGGQQAVDLMYELNKEAIEMKLFRTSSEYRSFLHDIGRLPKASLIRKWKEMTVFPIGKENIIKDFYTRYIPKLEPLAAKFNQNTGTENNKNLGYQQILIREKMDATRTEKYLRDLKKKEKSNALHDIDDLYKRNLNYYNKLRNICTKSVESNADFFDFINSEIEKQLEDPAKNPGYKRNLRFIAQRLQKEVMNPHLDNQIALNNFKNLILMIPSLHLQLIEKTNRSPAENDELSEQMIINEPNAMGRVVPNYYPSKLFLKEMELIYRMTDIFLAKPKPTFFSPQSFARKPQDADKLNVKAPSPSPLRSDNT